MDGLFINNRRPASKKAVREAVRNGDRIYVERTSLFHGNGRWEPVEALPVGTRIDFVGPDPYTSRKFYGQLTVTSSGVKVT